MIGTGMQNKLLEAMAMQTPCITTDLANNAIKAEHNVHILVGNTKEELIEAMKLLLEDHALREKIAKEGQIYVKTNYNWEKSTEKLRGFLEH
jgi:glycosyltransferase involved in cell wall biosynthesis